MELQEFLLNLDNENTLLESGPDQYLRHYTTLPGLLGILNKEKIQAYGYTDSKNNEVAVIRRSGDIKNIEDVAKNKNIVGYFEIAFHILNDKVKNIKKRTTNELWDTYNERIDNLLSKYNLKDKEKIIKDYKTVENIMSKEDYELLKDLIHDLNLSLIRKEGEEKIINSIPLNSKYMKFYFIKEIDNLSRSAKSTLKYHMIMYPKLFEENEEYKKIKAKL